MGTCGRDIFETCLNERYNKHMGIYTSLILFIIGFYILVKSASILVNGATSLARLYNISTWFIGVAIVGAGTSLPEFSVSVASALSGDTIGLSTIIGTNIFNILVILGFSALFIPIILKKQWVTNDFFVHSGVIAIAAAVILLPLFGDSAFIGVTRDEGLFLFILLLVWLWFLFHRRISEEETSDYKIFALFTSVIMVCAGIIGVFFGGQWVVAGARTIAELFGVSDTLIGLTIVAIGTSLPELTVSFVALFKRTVAIAVGNVIGSSILNFLGIIGITALIQPILISETIRFDMFVVLLASLLLIFAAFVGRRFVIGRAEGVFFIVLYIAYIIFIIMRG